MRIFLVVFFAGMANAACPPGSCDYVQCEPVTCGSDEIFERLGGGCGCCDICVPYVPLGGYCMQPPGQYYKPTCATGLKCEFGKCVVDEIVSCREKAATVYQTWVTRSDNNWLTMLAWQQRMNTDPGSVPADLQPLPICEQDGSFARFQSEREGNVLRYYCASSSGTILKDYLINQLTSATCVCARDQADFAAMGVVGKTFVCESDGSYGPVQCAGTECYCSDSNGNSLSLKYSAEIWNIDVLGCDCARDEAVSPGTFPPDLCDEFGNYRRQVAATPPIPQA